MTAAQHRKTVYFHVGLPKTGTSTVQAMLRENACRLNDAGLQVICGGPRLRAVNRQAGRICKYGSRDYISRLRLALAARRLARDLRAVPQPRILVSDENLPGWRIDNLYRLPFDQGPRLVMEALKAAFRDFDIRWIMATREARDHMRSAYVFVTQQKGETADFGTWSQRVGRAERIDRLVADARAYWGDAGHVFRMEDQIASGTPWGHNILSHAGVARDTLAGLKEVDKENSGIADDLLPFVQRVNALNLDDGTRKELVRILRETRQAVIASVQRGPARGPANGDQSR